MTRPHPTVRVAAAQIAPVSGDVGGNLDRIDAAVRSAAAGGAQLVILPETATTGYFISDDLERLAEREDGQVSGTLSGLARSVGVHLAVGLPIEDRGSVFDAQILFGPDGARLATYKKVHLFALERQWYAAGDDPLVVETEIGRIGMTICYDLIFPEYIRKLVDMGAELVINSTNWISDRFQRDVWDWSGPMVESLARTRALENGVWLAMSNCTGAEQGFESLGHSCVVAPSGKIVASAGPGLGIATADVVYESEALTRWRSIATYRGDRRPGLYR